MTGEQLRAWREEAGLSLTDFASLLDVSPEQLNLWEHADVAGEPFAKIFAWAMECVEYELMPDKLNSLEIIDKTIARAEAVLASSLGTLREARARRG